MSEFVKQEFIGNGKAAVFGWIKSISGGNALANLRIIDGKKEMQLTPREAIKLREFLNGVDIESIAGIPKRETYSKKSPTTNKE